MDLLIVAIVVLIVAGLLLWVVSALLPIPAPFKTAVMILIVLVACVYLLNAAGVL